MLEFLAWISRRRRTYADVMEAWQTTCPRHTVWEDAMIDGYIEINRRDALRDPEVILTPRGLALLDGNSGHPKATIP